MRPRRWRRTQKNEEPQLLIRQEAEVQSGREDLNFRPPAPEAGDVCARAGNAVSYAQAGPFLAHITPRDRVQPAPPCGCRVDPVRHARTGRTERLLAPRCNAVTVTRAVHLGSCCSAIHSRRKQQVPGTTDRFARRPTLCATRGRYRYRLSGYRSTTACVYRRHPAKLETSRGERSTSRLQEATSWRPSTQSGLQTACASSTVRGCCRRT